LLKQRFISSPIDGVVAERLLVGGEYAYEQAPILTIAQIDPLNVEVFVPVALYGSIRNGMQATVFPEAPVGGIHTAIIEVLDPLIDARSGTFEFVCSFPIHTTRFQRACDARLNFRPLVPQTHRNPPPKPAASGPPSTVHPLQLFWSQAIPSE